MRTISTPRCALFLARLAAWGWRWWIDDVGFRIADFGLLRFPNPQSEIHNPKSLLGDPNGEARKEIHEGRGGCGAEGLLSGRGRRVAQEDWLRKVRRDRRDSGTAWSRPE